jgi:hypothetical protein
VAFIVPKSFNKASIQNRLNTDFHLTGAMDIPSDSFTLAGQKVNVPCVFQVWVHYLFMHRMICASDPIKNMPRIPVRPVVTCSDFDFVASGRGADFAIRRVGVNAGRIFATQVERRSVQSHLFVKAKSPGVLERMKALDLEHCPAKTNTAGCPSISKSDVCLMYESTQT